LLFSHKVLLIKEEVMKMLTKIEATYETGEKAPKEGYYECSTCDEEGKKVRVYLKKGDTFPQCSSCKNRDVWRQVHLTFPSYIKPYLDLHRN